MRLTGRVERLERWAEERSLWRQAERLVAELGGRLSIGEVAADLRRGRARFQALLAQGLSIEEAQRRFAEEEGLDPDEVLAEAERLAREYAWSEEGTGGTD